MTTPRLSPSIWRHDAYTLRKLAEHVAAIASRLKDGELAGDLSGGGTIVDLGAGSAPYRTLFDFQKIKYVSCDLGAESEVSIEPGKPVPLPDGVAKAVLSFQVLEHVWDLDWYLAEAGRMLADNGALILSTHGTWLYHPHPTDYRRWTRDGLVAELTTRGFIVEEIKGLVGPLAWTTQFRSLGFHHLLCKLPIVGVVLAGLMGFALNARMYIEDWLTPSEWIQTNAAVYVLIARKAKVNLA